MQTRRERIAQLLEESDHPLTAQDIAEVLGLENRNVVFEDIEHIAKSAKREGKRVLIRPASCGKCGYVFTPKSAKRPSRCPKCKSEWILLPGYLIRPSGKR
ncbi:MAG: transcriptional regulator [Candidatus Thorarchaeota archaeon]